MRSGSLFSGYGGLDLAVESALGVTPAWFCEYEPPTKDNPHPTQAPARILAQHWPDVPNHGDLTRVDWSTVEPVEVLTGGFPCQDVSAGGKRAGLKPGTRSGLWSYMAYAIDQLRPRLVVIENVRGLTYAEAHSDLEPCAWCLGDGTGQPPLRALGAVLGDLADLGYDARWHGLPACDIGAPHERFRVFVVAYPNGLGRGRGRPRIGAGSPDAAGRGQAAPDAADDRPQVERDHGTDAAQVAAAGRGEWPAADPDGVAVRQQPVAVAGRGGEAFPRPVGAAAADTVRGGRGRGAQVAVGDQVERAAARRPRGSDLAGDARAETAADADGDGRARIGRLETGARDADGCGSADVAWGPYESAIRRWERVLGRLAPNPTEAGPKGGRRLSPAFVEWMQGLPAGWVTGVPGLTRREQLRALGNGVVPQQADEALRRLLS